MPKTQEKSHAGVAYSPEFREEVVEAALARTGSLVEVAKKYHVSRFSINKWVAEYKKAHPPRHAAIDPGPVVGIAVTDVQAVASGVDTEALEAYAAGSRVADYLQDSQPMPLTLADQVTTLETENRRYRLLLQTMRDTITEALNR